MSTILRGEVLEKSDEARLSREVVTLYKAVTPLIFSLGWVSYVRMCETVLLHTFGGLIRSFDWILVLIWKVVLQNSPCSVGSGVYSLLRGHSQI